MYNPLPNQQRTLSFSSISRLIAGLLLFPVAGWVQAETLDSFDKQGSGWTTLEGLNKLGDATLKVEQQRGVVAGAIKWPIEAVTVKDGELRASVRFLMPEALPNWASVSLALYGSNPADRLYAAVLLRDPNAGANEVTIFIEEPSANARRHATKGRTLATGVWHTLEAELTGGELKTRVWAEGEPAPDGWDARVRVVDMLATVEGVGIRTFATEVTIDDFSVNRSAVALAQALAPVTAPQPGAAKGRVARAMDRTLIPEPVFDAEPELVDLYWRTWEIAHDHVKHSPGAPQTPYMDEALWNDTIWIWDTAFMSLFCRYSPEQFPGVESLLNFYAVMHDGATSPLIVQHPDNPPLFAWVEYDQAKFTADDARLKWLLNDTKYLQRHYDWFQNARQGMSVKGFRKGVDLRPHAKGFFWSGVASGMDNSPRFTDRDALRVDAIAQQGLSALYISRMAKRIGDDALATKFQAEYERIKELVNRNYWDDQDGIYYDIKPSDGSFVRVKTPAAYWPMLAEMCSPEQANRLADHARDPEVFGGVVPWPSVARSDPNFDGNYWRGAVWLPLAYMSTKALEKYGYHDLANELALTLVRHMNRTYRDVTPNTVWECYDPNKPGPGMHDGKRSRRDFCGWSALGPTSMLLENVLGFHDIDAVSTTVSWRLHQAGRHGVRRLRVGGATADLIFDAGVVTVATDKKFTLVVNGERHTVDAGESTIVVTP